ncbi:hypothetical protein ASE12_12925 [Aeromicrobium sp. Root236]|nr:hypothetical protein ASE12_12925 [Aeromicrobium sp. Root236]
MNSRSDTDALLVGHISSNGIIEHHLKASNFTQGEHSTFTAIRSALPHQAFFISGEGLTEFEIEPIVRVDPVGI